MANSGYDREIIGKYDKARTVVDVYDVLKAFNVTDPALAHLAKKALCAGIRGHKNLDTDLIDIIDAAYRAKELNDCAYRETPERLDGAGLEKFAATLLTEEPDHG